MTNHECRMTKEVQMTNDENTRRSARVSRAEREGARESASSRCYETLNLSNVSRL